MTELCPRRLIVTRHAMRRYFERVPGATAAGAREQLQGRAAEAAIATGARVVRIGRCRVILEHTRFSTIIITVLSGGGGMPVQLRPACRGGLAPIGNWA